MISTQAESALNEFSLHSGTPITRRQVGANVWLTRAKQIDVADLSTHELKPEVLKSEAAVERAMLEELEAAAAAKTGGLVIILPGGRGAQALHRLLGERARSGEDKLLRRMHVFTQDALGPIRMNNSLSFVRDFERLLGPEFFRQVKSFTPIRTDAEDFEKELAGYVNKLETVGGIDIFFLGHGPEPDNASHLAYIRSCSGTNAESIAGIIPVSSQILEHHITKFKAGGAAVNAEAEAECRQATHILTLGPAAILGARRIVQSIVDADTAPAKRASYRPGDRNAISG